MCEVAEMVEQLAVLTEAQVSAATSLNAPAVSELARERADLMFELEILLQSSPPLSEGEQIRVHSAAQRLARAEHRLGRALESLISVLQPPSEAPTIYGRRGTVQEVHLGHA